MSDLEVRPDSRLRGIVSGERAVELLHEHKTGEPLPGQSSSRELIEDDPCPGCGGQLTWCDCGQGDPGEHLICLHCGDDAEDCQCEGPPDEFAGVGRAPEEDGYLRAMSSREAS
jgi:hypothetical protein